MEFGGPDWNYAAGDWEPMGNTLLETSKTPSTPTRYYRNIGFESYEIRFRAAFLSAYGPNGWGEIKFLYTDANETDNERIDFLVHAGVVRLTAGSIQLHAPLRFGMDQILECVVTCDRYTISLSVNGIPLFERAPIGTSSNGWIGLGTYDATARFSDFEVRSLEVTAEHSVTAPSPKVFISHSCHDAELAARVVDLLGLALGLSAPDIRCTSVDGHGLPGGANINEQVRREVLSVPVLIGLISPVSMRSAYVLFELGARWGRELPLIPLLAPGVEPSSLREPLSSLHALSASKRPDLQQLVGEVAKHAKVSAEAPQVYDRAIDALLQSSLTVVEVPTTPGGTSPDGFDDAEEVLRRHCERQHPDDYTLQEYCIRQQRQALGRLRQGRPADIPQEVFDRIREKAAREFHEDYVLRLYVEDQQCQAWRNLQRGRT